MSCSYDYICRQAEALKRRYGETDPFKICRELNVMIFFAPMGMGAEDCKGFFLNQSRIRSITINSDLSRQFQRIICSHELGHCVLHKNKAGMKAFHDFGLFDTVSALEYEANIFAAEFLLDDDEVLASLNEDQSFFQAAAEMHVPAEILDFKFRILKWKGYKVMDAPLQTSGDWLKNAGDGGECDEVW